MKTYDPTTHVNHDIKKQKRFDRNVCSLKLITKAVNFCSKQVLQLHGHSNNSSDLFSRDRNFLAVIKSLADMDPILQYHPKAGYKNAQMTLWKIQNDIISCIAE